MKKQISLILVILVLAASPAAGSQALAVGDEKVSVDEVYYLMGLELGGSEALASLTAAGMSPEERVAFLKRISRAVLFYRGAILKGLHLDPKISAQLRWNQINLLANAYLASLEPKLNFTEARLKERYNKNRSRYTRPDSARVRLMFSPDEGRVRSALIAVLSGEPFETAAERFGEKNYLMPPENSFAWFKKGELPEPLDKAAFNLPLSKVSGPVEAPGGYWLVEAMERKKGGVLSFAEARDMVREDLEEEILAGEIASLEKRFPVTMNPSLLGGAE